MEIEADVIDAMSMTILPENVLMIMPHVEKPIMPKTHFWECQTMIQHIHSVIQMEKILTWI